MPLTDEQIRALRDGCKNVSRPPWVISRPIIEDYSWMEIPFEIGTADRGLAWRVAKATDAAHIARCDPQTISELCTRVLAAEARVKSAERKEKAALFDAAKEAAENEKTAHMLRAAQARIKVLEDALRPFTEATLAIDKAWIRKARKALEEAPKAPL